MKRPPIIDDNRLEILGNPFTRKMNYDVPRDTCISLNFRVVNPRSETSIRPCCAIDTPRSNQALIATCLLSISLYEYT